MTVSPLGRIGTLRRGARAALMTGPRSIVIPLARISPMASPIRRIVTSNVWVIV